MTEKKELEYIGRYGEVLEYVKELENAGFKKDQNQKTDPKKRTFTAIGLDEFGNKCVVVFQVSPKTNKKHGEYKILSSTLFAETLSQKPEKEVCHYVNDVLHGEDNFYCDPPNHKTCYKTIYFLRGRQLEGVEPRGIERYAEKFGGIEHEERKEKSKEAHAIRKLFEDSSVVKAIKTGDPVKVRNAVARVAMKNTKKEIE